MRVDQTAVENSELSLCCHSGDCCDIAEACFENDRDRLREFIMSWLELSASSQDWFSPDMSFAEKLWAHFYSSDASG